MEAPYNKIPDWDYGKMCAFFGPSFKSRYYLVKTPDELMKVLEDPEFNAAECTQVSLSSMIGLQNAGTYLAIGGRTHLRQARCSTCSQIGKRCR